MARQLRDLHAGVFHVYTHSVWAAQHFLDDRDRMIFLRELARATARADWTCLAYCLMRTHYHLILDVDDGALATGMQALNFRYAMAYNHRHRMKGHVHGRRYGSRRITDDGDLLNTFRYVMRNPVEAMLCPSPAEWPWSSCAATLGLDEPQSFVNASRIVGCADGPLDLAQAALRALVDTP